MQVIIRHPKTDQEYQIAVSDFRHGKHYLDPKTGERMTYADAGFKIISQADGRHYDEPKSEKPKD